MTEFILFGIVLLALATLYIRLKNEAAVLFDKVCNAYLLFVCTHIVGVVVLRYVFKISEAVTFPFPFVMAYGPFFYIGLKSACKKLEKRDLYIHFFPFVFFTAIYIIIGVFKINFFRLFCVVEYVFVGVSLVGYAVWAVRHPGVSDEEGNAYRKQLYKTSGYSLGVIGLLFLMAIVSGYLSVTDIKPQSLIVITFSGIFISIVFGFVFTITNLVSIKQHTNVVSDDINEETVTALLSVEENPKENKNRKSGQKYNKSAFSPAVVDDYKEKLTVIMTDEKAYLDNELTLEALSKKMNMPMHHLTQLFNVYLGENFNQYINRFRVEYACSLLVDNEDLLSIEQIAFNSGFNSKVSFNRHFKNCTGYSPKEYVLNSKSTDN